EDIGKTQSFAFNPDRQEIYAYEAETHKLVYMDALTLEVFKSVPVPDLSPGDVWIRWLPLNDTIVLSSEADAEIGVPLYVFDRESGEVVTRLPFPVIPTAYLTFHPEKPLMYFNSFKDPYFAVWDMQSFEITWQVEITPRTDRMVFAEKDNEVWVASPLDGAVLRYDADTLEYTGRINTALGDRTLTLDTQRNLLLVGNFMNNRLAVIDLSTNKPVASFYLGPWIRTIALDMENGIAYVSTVRGLFKVNYAQPAD
ncbi:MAG: WD40 repeat domain-containing protein, partial [Chloroflexi bacterium]|nr:WD40 repeat domain-containing protein [Chloroflexota bacterium]